MINISKSNAKLGLIANISLPPIASCVVDPPCEKLCYARKAYRYAVMATRLWEENLAEYKADGEKFFGEIRRFFDSYKRTYFRWHVAGDIPDQEYFAKMNDLARDLPHIHFMAFTRRRWAVSGYDNLVIIQSFWLTDLVPETPGLYAKVIPKNEDPPGFLCHKFCDECRMCWHLKPPFTVYFHLH